MKIVNGCERMTDFAANSFAENYIFDVCLGSRCAPADCSKLFLLFKVYDVCFYATEIV